MPEIGPAGTCAVASVGGGANDFGDHWEATDAGNEGIGGADGEDIPAEVGAALPGVGQVDGFGAEEGFEAANEGEDGDPVEASGGGDV